MDKVILDEPALEPALSRLVRAGAGATVLMTFAMYLGPWIGLANLDLAGLLGALLSGQVPEIFESSWWSGMIWHFLNGSVLFPLLYAYLILPGKHGSPAVKGALWGLTLWLLSQALLVPMFGGGFFSRETMDPTLVVLGSLISHLIYGITLGMLAGRPSEAAVQWSHHQAA